MTKISLAITKPAKHTGQAHPSSHKPHEKQRRSVIAQMARFQDPLRKPHDEELSKYSTLENLWAQTQRLQEQAVAASWPLRNHSCEKRFCSGPLLPCFGNRGQGDQVLSQDNMFFQMPLSQYLFSYKLARLRSLEQPRWVHNRDFQDVTNIRLQYDWPR